MATITDRMTPTEHKFYQALLDGPKTKSELKNLLWDEMANSNTIQAHITRLRSKLPKHLLIVFSNKLYSLHRIVRRS